MKQARARLCTLTLALTLSAPAWAVCARTYAVPVAPLGISIVVNDDVIKGIYPKLLRTISAHGACRFALSVVPRARLEALFEAGKADMLMPATNTPRRDLHGQFIALMSTRATLISIDSRHAPLRSIRELLERRELRVALVRGNDYGEAYQDALRQLTAQGRVYMEVDPLGVARLLGAGLADVTIMTPMSFTGAIKEDRRVAALLGKLRIEPLRELPWHDSGIYLSKATMDGPERDALARLLTDAFKSSDAWDDFRRYYPPEVLAASARPR